MVWWFRGRASHVEQNRANSLTRDVIATRMEIAESDPPGVVREKLEAGFAMAYGEGEEAVRAAHVVGTWLGFDLGTDEAARAGVPTEPQSVRDQATVALGRYFALLARSQPVVILLEDLHWADSTSMRLLDDAERMWRDIPVMVVATTRASLLEERPRWGSGLDHHVRLTLGALSRRESRTLVLELLQKVDDPPADLVDLVVDSAEGNPFYVEELVTWLIDSGVVVPDSPRWRIVDELVGRLVVPPSLKGLLQARLDALTSSERAALQRASVVGRIFWDDAVTHLAPDGDANTPDTDAFDHLLARDLVFERELSAFDSAREFLFKHALLRDVAYDSVLRARRREYHRRAARWLADVTARTGRVEEYAAIVAEHFDLAHEPEAAAWYLRAGRRATRVFALDEATHLLERAEQLVPADDTRLRFDVVAAREDVLERQGDRTAQSMALRRMAELCAVLDDPACTVATLLGESRRAFEASDYDDAVGLATRATDVARESGLDDRVAEGYLWAGKALTWHGRGAEARERLDTALSIARTEERTTIVAESLRYLAMLASNEGRFTDALELGAQAREEFAKDGDIEAESTALAQHAVTLFNLGRLDESRDLFEKALPVFMASGHLYRQAVVLGNLASSSFLMGDLSAGGALVPPGDRADRHARRRRGGSDRPDHPRPHRAVDRPVADGSGELRVRLADRPGSRRDHRRPGRRNLARHRAGGVRRAPGGRRRPRPVRLHRRRRRHGRSPERRAGAVGARRTPCWRPVMPLDWTRPTRPRAGRARCSAGAGSRRLSPSATSSDWPSPGPEVSTRCMAADDAAAIVARLDRQAVDVSMRPPSVLGELWDALAGGGPDHAQAGQQVRALARAYVDRRVAGAEEPETEAGFLAGAVGRPTGPAARRVLTWTSTWVSPAAETSPRASTASCARRSATDASVRATGFHRPAIWPPSSSCHGGR